MITLLNPNERREEALSVGFEATDWIFQPAYQDYEDAVSDWTTRLMVNGDRVVGTVYTRGPEVHVSVLPEWRKRWATRGILKQVIPEPLAITRVTHGHEYMYDILHRLGFEQRGDYFVRDGYGH